MSHDSNPHVKDKSFFAKTCRYWMFTIFEKPRRFFVCPDYVGKKKPIRYIVAGLETCPETGRKHIQGYIELSDPQRGPGVQKLLADLSGHYDSPKEIWCRPRYSTRAQCIEYCKKEDNWYELGSVEINQGERSDLEGLYELVKEKGERYAFEANPVLASRCSRAIEKVHEYNICNRPRKVQVIRNVQEYDIDESKTFRYWPTGLIGDRPWSGYRSEKYICVPCDAYESRMGSRFPWYLPDARRFAEWEVVYVLAYDQNLDIQNGLNESIPDINAQHSKAQASPSDRRQESLHKVVQKAFRNQQAPYVEEDDFQEDTIYY